MARLVVKLKVDIQLGGQLADIQLEVVNKMLINLTDLACVLLLLGNEAFLFQDGRLVLARFQVLEWVVLVVRGAA